MARIQYYVLFATICRVLGSFTIKRAEYDTIKNVNQYTCGNMQGNYNIKTGNCQCPKELPNFMSKQNKKSTCSNHQRCEELSLNTTIFNSYCAKQSIASVSVWNTQTKKNKQIGSWINVTRKTLKYFVIKRSSDQVTIRFNGGSRYSWQGQLIKIVNKCTRKCYLLKIQGERTYPFRTEIFDMNKNPRTPPTTTEYVPPTISVEKKGGLKVEVIAVIVVMSTVIVVVICLVLYVFRRRLLVCVKSHPKIDVIDKNDIHVTLERTTTPVYASVHNPTSASEYQTIALTNDGVYIEPSEGVYYSNVHTPVAASDISSDYTPLTQFNSSPYSALSYTDCEASIQQSKYNSSFDYTPKNKNLGNHEYNDDTVPEYHELFADSADQATNIIPLTESANLKEVLYYEVDAE